MLSYLGQLDAWKIWKAYLNDGERLSSASQRMIVRCSRSFAGSGKYEDSMKMEEVLRVLLPHYQMWKLLAIVLSR